MAKIYYFILLILFIASNKLFAANVDIPLNNPIYFEIDRLRSLGHLQSLVTLSKPYNTYEVKEVLSNIQDKTLKNKVAELMREIERYQRNALLDTSLDIYYTNKETRVSNYEGLFLSKDDIGSTLSTRLQYLFDNGFSLVATPTFRYTHNEADTFFRDTYLRYSFYNLNLTIGRESLWWGPGRHGTLLLSNNAKPIDMIRLNNDRSLRFDSLSFLGNIDFDILFGRLSKQTGIVNPDRSLGSGNPKIFAAKISISPSPYFEMGLYRTAIFGGADRPEDLSTIWDVVFPFGDVENIASEEPGDQKGGLTMKILLPNDVQPFTLYGEYAGEDEANNLPSKFSYIVGLDLIDLAGTEGLNLNLEYLRMDESNAWYGHHLYKEGYTNDGFIMGHTHGGTGEEVNIELTYQPNMTSTYNVGYQRETFKDESSATTMYVMARYRLGDKSEINTKLLGTSIDDDFRGFLKINYTYLLWQ